MRARLRKFLFHEAVHIILKNTLAHDAHGHEERGQHREQSQREHHAPRLALQGLRAEPLAVEMQQARAHIGREADEDGVDEEEIKRAEEVEYMPRGQSVARRAEGRHKGRGDGHAGNDVALAFRTEGDKAGRAAAGGNEYVVDSRRGASQEF